MRAARGRSGPQYLVPPPENTRISPARRVVVPLVLAGAVVAAALGFSVYGVVTGQRTTDSQASRIAALGREQKALAAQTAEIAGLRSRIAGMQSKIKSDESDIGLLLGGGIGAFGDIKNLATAVVTLETDATDYADDINCLEGDISDIANSGGGQYTYNICNTAPGG